jgi:hypothetical protein
LREGTSAEAWPDAGLLVEVINVTKPPGSLGGFFRDLDHRSLGPV